MDRSQRIGVAYAVVASSLALILALGGVGYAALTIPKNSVGSAQIKNNAVKTGHVKNGTLKRADFAAGQLPSGATGQAGGALAGTYPAPGLAASAPGVALGALTTPGITVTPTVTTWFNRLGGKPSIVKTSDPSGGVYSVTFPGLGAAELANVLAVGNAPGGFVSITVSGGTLTVTRFGNTGTVSASPWSIVLYAANPDGGASVG
jgi:hypothetical protein